MLLDMTHAKDSRDLTWLQQAFYTHLKPRHYRGNISQLTSSDLPLSHGFDAILMVVDQFSKEVELIPCTKTCSALDMAKLFMHNVWKHHGLPCSITSDRGPQFAAQVEITNKASQLP